MSDVTGALLVMMAFGTVYFLQPTADKLAQIIDILNRPDQVCRPDKTELELFLLMLLIVVPFAYFGVRTVLALFSG
jgi:hypothetical protein